MKKNQYDKLDCSLYVLNYFLEKEKLSPPSINELKKIAVFNQNGISLEELKRISNIYNLEIDVWNCDFEQLLKLDKECFPIAAIVKNVEQTHMVVIESISDGIVAFYDPAQGNLKKNYKDFLSIYLNVLISFEKLSKCTDKKISNQNEQESDSLLKRNFTITKQHFIILVCYLVADLLMFLIPYLNKFLISKVIPYQANNHLWFTLSVFLLVLILSILVKIVVGKYENKIIIKTNFRYWKIFINNLSTLNRKYLNVFSSLEMKNRFNAILQLSKLNVTFMPNLINAIISICLAVFILYKLNSILMLSLVVYCFSCLILGFYNKLFYDKKYKELILESQIQDNLFNCYYEVLKTEPNFYLLKQQLSKLQEQNNKLEEQILGFSFFSINFSSFNHFLEYLFPFLIIFIGTYEIWNSNLTFNDLIFFMTGASLLTRPIKSIPELFISLSERNKNLEMLNFFNWKQNSHSNNTQRNLNEKIKQIKIKELKFKYENSYKEILNIEKLIIDSHLIIKGANGSGKSTFCKLITGTLDYQLGQISINNKDLEIFQNKSYLEKVYLINSSYLNINLSILDFLNIENPDRFWEFLEINQLVEIWKDFLLPNNLFLPLNSLSQGQQQFLKILKTMMIEYDVVVFDEAFENFEHSKFEFLKNIVKNHLQKAITIEISHNQRYLFEDEEKVQVWDI
ncbi:Mbov_0121 family peptidase domain-containing ABC transporter [Mycoplasmopsis glycophila]|uniref:Metal ABC transporter ATP-binding protein n=1 Tax=Mycoplasmopsis glycophila TaxID=171285 RepID=A0A449AV97_9BACT|nr:ATP-binding cassette domain-containing protein [Mycoplasmopsis glycophila]VEU70416.1 metal ABC transporter ATP-binding protein [Mycoplasmopsis glycophila]